MTEMRRSLPSVGSLLESPELQPLLARAPRTTVADAVRAAIESARGTDTARPRSPGEWREAIEREFAAITAPSLRRVINATGVVLHTNLGRAPLPVAAIDAVRETAAGFCNLEYDLDAGARSSRYSHCLSLLTELTGCEDALVVNNCAAALVLAIDALARGKEVIVSRGELIEIGGSFRIPDIMRRGGGRLVEVGTTNRTHLRDYESALTAETGAIVKVHRSNFAVAGFVAEVDVAELAALGARHQVPVIHDLGSGLMFPLDQYGLSGEPTARDAVRAGSSVVTMSGDKLLGGPQAGILLGKREVIERLRSAPLARALRVDKLAIAALGATLALHRDPDVAMREIPALAMLTVRASELEARAAGIVRELASHGMSARVLPSSSTVGGGAFPTATLDSFAVELDGAPAKLEQALRAGDPPVIGRVQNGRLALDLRAVAPAEDATLIQAIAAAGAR